MADKVTFIGSFPAIASAIKVSGNGDGMRIMIDIPEYQMAEALKLLLFRQTAIQVTIEAHETDALKNRANQGDGKKQHELSKGQKRKSEWSSSQE